MRQRIPLRDYLFRRGDPEDWARGEGTLDGTMRQRIPVPRDAGRRGGLANRDKTGGKNKAEADARYSVTASLLAIKVTEQLALLRQSFSDRAPPFSDSLRLA
jgi:hypothetical protein